MPYITKSVIASYSSIYEMNIRYTVLFVAAIAMASCKNNDNVFPKQISSYLNVVNASADTLNVYLNGTRQNNTTSLFPGGQSFYITVPAGVQNYSFKKAGSPNVLFSVPLNLKDSVDNSIYVTGETAAGSFTSVDVPRADSVHAALRFVNASPDAGSLDVAVGDSLKFFPAVAFKSVTAFLPVGGGQKRIRVYLAGAANAAIDTTITIVPSNGYTLFSEGSVNNKNKTFKIGVSSF